MCLDSSPTWLQTQRQRAPLNPFPAVLEIWIRKIDSAAFLHYLVLIWTKHCQAIGPPKKNDNRQPIFSHRASAIYFDGGSCVFATSTLIPTVVSHCSGGLLPFFVFPKPPNHLESCSLFHPIVVFFPYLCEIKLRPKAKSKESFILRFCFVPFLFFWFHYMLYMCLMFVFDFISFFCWFLLLF